MAKTNMRATRVAPQTSGLVTAAVARREQISPHLARVTLSGPDLQGFHPLGFDQWFRLFLPTADGQLDGLPDKLTMGSYLRFLTQSSRTRPKLRNYTVRAYRPSGADGPEIDVDVVLHAATDDSAGPGEQWARTCSPGSPVGLIDEGIGFNPGPDADEFLLVADESGLPAVAGILASLPDQARGHAVIEVPEAADQQDLHAPAGMEIIWLHRGTDHATVAGTAALAAATETPVPDGSGYCWVVGEQALATGMRRHWVQAGVPKDRIMFCGYWRRGTGH